MRVGPGPTLVTAGAHVRKCATLSLAFLKLTLTTRVTDDDHCMQTTSSTDRFDFSDGPGLMGFMSSTAYGFDRGYIDDITVKTDTDDDVNGTYETTEHVEDFDLSSSDYSEDAFEHDAAGNLIYDGNKKYTFDAYNRLVKVEKAFKDDGVGGGALQTGSTIAVYAYDCRDRRVRKDTYVTGELDYVEHFYYAGHVLVETRNQSDQVLQQHVWDSLAPGSGQYIDSLAEVSNNTDPSVDNTTDQKLYALQDQQFNVLALADATGAVVERYEYTLYGKREVHNAAYAVIGQSAYGVRFGFQGRYHDVESRLVFYRTRYLDPVTGRFISRDIRGGLYPDGMNTYVGHHLYRLKLDPWGMEVDPLNNNPNPADYTGPDTFGQTPQDPLVNPNNPVDPNVQPVDGSGTDTDGEKLKDDRKTKASKKGTINRPPTDQVALGNKPTDKPGSYVDECLEKNPKLFSKLKAWTKRLPWVGGIVVTTALLAEGASAQEAIGTGIVDGLNPLPVGIEEATDAGNAIHESLDDIHERMRENRLYKIAKGTGLTREEVEKLFGTGQADGCPKSPMPMISEEYLNDKYGKGNWGEGIMIIETMMNMYGGPALSYE